MAAAKPKWEQSLWQAHNQLKPGNDKRSKKLWSRGETQGFPELKWSIITNSNAFLVWKKSGSLCLLGPIKCQSSRLCCLWTASCFSYCLISVRLQKELWFKKLIRGSCHNVVSQDSTSSAELCHMLGQYITFKLELKIYCVTLSHCAM